ncbi:DeoR/GlpR family DNA-binding transcription regulator [Donghicola sp. XS_ASV15]|uniref:DeoR/GlpR family DNA-binding transcription regulator n=1 Tax=Donghicola sp. XS_ASV15 TaxID=3241295 RepID=UPI003515CA88
MGLKPQDRRREIAGHVTAEGEVSVDTLAEIYGVSVETIRRDLARLSEEGHVRKVHGGAKPARLHSEPSFAERMTEDTDEKRVIGQKLRSEIKPGDTLFMDTGSSTLLACEALLDLPDLTVITNSVLIAQKLYAAPRVKLFLLGGAFAGGNQQTVGAMVIEQIEKFQADHAVMTLTGLDEDAGVTFSDHHEADIARAILRRSENVMFLAHASKYGRRAGFRACDLTEIDTLLTMTPPPEPLAAALQAAGVTLP